MTATEHRISHWIDGTVVPGSSGRGGPVFNPATGERAATVDFASVDEVDAAVASARAAFPGWRATSLSRRAEVMFRMRELVDANRKEIASLLTAEHGKVLSDALGEVARGLENIEFACGVPNLMKGGYSEQAATGVDVYSIRQPLGVVAGITPFNFPAMVPMWMFANALACGNTFVLKPSERDPSASLLLAELLQEAGLPDGAFNVVQGDKEAVDAILAHSHIAAVSFVGSTPIAEYIQAEGTRHGKRVQALGGAKNFIVVMPDADLDRAMPIIGESFYGCAGERCLAGSVLLPVGPTHEEVRDRMVALAEGLTVGDGLEPGTAMGPVISARHRERVLGYVERGVAEGATLVADGRRRTLPDEGFFVGPTVFDGVAPSMSIGREEIFGPVATVSPVRNLDEAFRVMEAHPNANATSIFTSSGKAAREFAHRATASMVGVNIGVAAPMAYFPFGGARDSFFGDLKVHGRDAFEFYTDKKVTISRWF